MRKSIPFSVSAAKLIFFLFLSLSSAAFAEARIALVIGSSRYPELPRRASTAYAQQRRSPHRRYA